MNTLKEKDDFSSFKEEILTKVQYAEISNKSIINDVKDEYKRRKGFMPPSDEMIVEVYAYIIANLPTKEDMIEHKEQIINNQKREIIELKQLLKDIMIELRKKSFPNILSIISTFGLGFSIMFLILTFFYPIIEFRSIHFIIISVGFSLILILAMISRSKLPYKH